MKEFMLWAINQIRNQFFNNKSIDDMTNSTRKQLILDVAKKMCAQENRLSTKKLKIEMRNQFPDEQWNKYANGHAKGVSDLFHELVQEGHFVSIADNGTYQTYADTTLPITSRKGDTYIPDMEESAIVSRGTTIYAGQVQTGGKARATKQAVQNLGTALKTASKTAQKSAAKQAAVAKQPRTADGRFSHKTNTQVLSNKKVQVKQTHNVPTISRTKALNMMENSNGKTFTATFIKQDGTRRVMNAKYEATNPLGFVVATDVILNATRNINLNTLEVLIDVNGKTFNVK